MRFDPISCPTCGAPARGIVQTLAGVSVLSVDPDGSAEWEGWTDIWWDESHDQTDETGRVRMIDDDAHEWWAIRAD